MVPVCGQPRLGRAGHNVAQMEPAHSADSDHHHLSTTSGAESNAMTSIQSQPLSKDQVEEYENEDRSRTIKITAGTMNLWQWGMTLPESERVEFERIYQEHEAFVAAAQAVGDVTITKDGDDFTLVWKSFEIHCKWIATMSHRDHLQYLDYWRRYREYVG